MSSVFITCAVTGSGDTVGKSDKVPFTPEAIANDCIAAAKAGAAIVHIHVRDPITGAPSREVEYYAEVVDRIRSSDVDPVVNLTAGMGGDVTFGSVERPLPLADVGTDMVGATERLATSDKIRPEICTIDCGSMNFGEGDYVMTNTPSVLHEMARQVQQTRGASRDRGVRHRTPVAGEVARRAGPRSTTRSWCSCAWGSRGERRRISTRSWRWSTTSPTTGRSARSRSVGCSCSTSHWRRSPAATCVSVSRTTLYLDRGQLATNADLVERAVDILARHEHRHHDGRRGAREDAAHTSWLNRPDRRAPGDRGRHRVRRDRRSVGGEDAAARRRRVVPSIRRHRLRALAAVDPDAIAAWRRSRPADRPSRHADRLRLDR